MVFRFVRSPIAAWNTGKHRAYICDLLQSSTDRLKAASSAPSELAAAALSAISAADSKWPLFGKEVDIPCLLAIIPEDVLVLQHTKILADPNAKICLATDVAAAAGKGPPARGSAGRGKGVGRHRRPGVGRGAAAAAMCGG